MMSELENLDDSWVIMWLVGAGCKAQPVSNMPQIDMAIAPGQKRRFMD